MYTSADWFWGMSVPRTEVRAKRINTKTVSLMDLRKDQIFRWNVFFKNFHLFRNTILLDKLEVTKVESELK